MKKTFKSILSLTLCFMMLLGTIAVGGEGFADMLEAVSISAFADEAVTGGTCGNDLTWSYDADNYTLTISGTGNMTNYKSGGSPWNSLKGNIKYVIIEEGVTSVGAYAFIYMDNIEEVIIPVSLKKFGAMAFAGTTGLKKLEYKGTVADWCAITYVTDSTYRSQTYEANPINYSHNLWINGEKITELVIPDTVSSVSAYAFFNMTDAASVKVPSGLTDIGALAFYGIKTVIYEDSEMTEDYGALSINGFVDGPLVYEDETKSVLVGCASFASGDIVLDDAVTKICMHAFRYCSFNSLTLPAGVDTIDDYAFSSCDGLGNLYFKGTVKDWCKFNFMFGILDEFDEFYIDGSLVKNLVIPDDVTSIGMKTFSYCKTLESVEIGEGTEEVGGGAFLNCDNLKTVSISDTVTALGWSCFSDCKNLETVYLGKSIETIGDCAFASDSNIKDIYYNSTQTDWEKIDIIEGEFNGNSVIKNALYYENYDPSLDVAWVHTLYDGTVMYKVDGLIYHIDSLVEGDAITLPDPPEKEGYEFAGWSDVTDSSSVPDVMSGRDLVYEANWNLKKYTITYYVRNSESESYTEYKTVTYFYGDNIEMLPVKTASGIVFSEWAPYYAGTMPAQNIETYSTGSVSGKESAVTNPTAESKIIATGGKVDYRTRVTLKATASGVPEGYYLAIYEGDNLLVKGDNESVTLVIGEMKADKIYTVRIIDDNGVIQKDASGNKLQKDVTINVNAKFFKKIVAFFKGIFGSLPSKTIQP